ncbi:MAG: hypothetical protein M3144_05560 [Actinomycetota bacterium]|nr:hypothetical protein [Actinomycetota bacterium]
MTTLRVTYEGPSSLAVPTATQLADAEGVELTSSEAPEKRSGGRGEVRLRLTVEGSTDAVLDAVARVREGLPAGATLSIE